MPPTDTKPPLWVTKKQTGPAATYKVAFFGEAAVGKTSVLHRYKRGTCDGNVHATVGFDFAAFSMDIDGVPLCLKVWDTAGQERFRTLTRQHYRGAKGLLLVYSFDSNVSFLRIKSWIDSIEKHGLSPMREVIFIVGNKYDIPDDQKEVDIGQAERFAAEFNCRHFVTSAKTGHGINELFLEMATALKDGFGPHCDKSSSWKMPGSAGAGRTTGIAGAAATAESVAWPSVPCHRADSFQLHNEGRQVPVMRHHGRSCCRTS